MVSYIILLVNSTYLFALHLKMVIYSLEKSQRVERERKIESMSNGYGIGIYWFRNNSATRQGIDLGNLLRFQPVFLFIH